ncbi:DHH phosphoesterase [Annulohypoxylon maeteangense]|uniref:DHH phosphoesterase n=1 Tax=Annulohypoxylon maeteangense TaxID=1927788 RepID=UPI002008C0DF|nr:DHH phosphoesterase [Annulohypoxylon maeteangense]KAI0888971.1 DHH phosphoesterase [Annulohypoxylon maeteangense]
MWYTKYAAKILPQQMLPQRSLQAFLTAARATLTAPPLSRSGPLHFVVGNESADLDSLCSTLLLAYFRSHTPPHILHVPLCHLPREDLALRPEFGAVLKCAGVTVDDVLTLSEMLPMKGRGRAAVEKGVLKPEDTRWLLVDHNVLTGRLGKDFGDRVIGCIDHHDDEGVVPKDAEPRVIKKTGSCMSLVLEQCRETWDEMASRGKLIPNKSEINEQLAYLALAPILIDTSNLKNKDKTTENDVRAVGLAERWILSSRAEQAATRLLPTSPISTSTYDRDSFFAEVSALKEDISQLVVRDILRKDYKEWTEGSLKLGTSSVPQSFTFLIKHAGTRHALSGAVNDWIVRNKLDVLAVLTTSKDDKGVFRRELMVWVKSLPYALSAVKGFMEGEGREKLGLVTWGEGMLDEVDAKGSWKRCWRQEKVEFSRKQIAPMLRDVLRGV